MLYLPLLYYIILIYSRSKTVCMFKLYNKAQVNMEFTFKECLSCDPVVFWKNVCLTIWRSCRTWVRLQLWTRIFHFVILSSCSCFTLLAFQLSSYNEINHDLHSCFVFYYIFITFLLWYARLQTGRFMVWWYLSVRPSGSPSASFPHFSLTCFDILLSWNFAHNFVLLYYRSSSSVVNLRQVLWELCPFWNLEYWKYTVFRTFLLHALTYWAEILHMTLFYCTTDQVWVSSIFVGVMPLLELRILEIHSFPHFCLTCFDILNWNFAYDFVLLYYRSSSSVVNLRQVLWELCPFWNLEYWKYTVFRTFLLHALTYWAEILHMTLFYCTTDQVWVSSIFVGVMPLLELRILEIHSFPHFCLTCFDILNWNFAYDFVLLYYRSSSSVVNLRQFLL